MTATMETNSLMAGSAHVIQLAIAPVFLLTGVVALLNVLTGRLSRIIDRARFLVDKLRPPNEHNPKVQKELDSLKNRMWWVDIAITLCTLAALFVCVVIATLFVGFAWHLNISRAVVILFVCAILALISSLMSFLREIFLAISSVRIGMH